VADALDARSEILARIRAISGRDAPSLSRDEAWQAMPRSYRQTGALASAGCVDLLAERLRDYGAGVSRSQPAQLASTIAEILRQRNKKRVLVSPDVDPAWLKGENGCIFVTDDALSYQEIDSCDGVLTGCAVAIAGTGTLGLCHISSGRRALTLIPDYHLCVVRAEDVVETVPEAMHALDSYKTAPITLISGPSATADIEMTRIQGVHGPRVLDVVIVA